MTSELMMHMRGGAHMHIPVDCVVDIRGVGGLVELESFCDQLEREKGGREGEREEERGRREGETERGREREREQERGRMEERGRGTERERREGGWVDNYNLMT